MRTRTIYFLSSCTRRRNQRQQIRQPGREATRARHRSRPARALPRDSQGSLHSHVPRPDYVVGWVVADEEDILGRDV